MLHVSFCFETAITGVTTDDDITTDVADAADADDDIKADTTKTRCTHIIGNLLQCLKQNTNAEII